MLAYCSVLLLVLAGSGLTSERAMALGEEQLVHLARSSNPTQESMEAALRAAEMGMQLHTGQFSSQWYGHISHQNSNLRELSSNNPVWGPSYTYETGVKSKFPLGLSTTLLAYANKRSATSGLINDSARIGIKARAELDLWKNLWGYIDKNKSKLYKKQRDIQKIRNKMRSKQLEIEVRKLYWSLVANQRSMQVTQHLLTLARQQHREAVRRASLSIAENDEIARYSAQVASVEGSIYSIQYQEKSLRQALMQMLPKTGSAEIDLNRRDDKKITKAVFACTSWIMDQKQAPWQHTDYESLLQLDEEHHNLDLNEIKVSDTMQLSVFSEYDLTQNAYGFSQAAEDYASSQAFDYTVGINFSLPIGNQMTKSKNSQIRAKAQELASNAAQIRADVEARHTSMQQMIHLLNKILETQKKNGRQLSIVQKGSSKRYRQARISVDNLIQDQNAARASEIDQTNAQLAIIQEVLDYFKIFNKTPCSLNML